MSQRWTIGCLVAAVLILAWGAMVGSSPLLLLSSALFGVPWVESLGRPKPKGPSSWEVLAERWATREEARVLDPEWAARLDQLLPIENPGRQDHQVRGEYRVAREVQKVKDRFNEEAAATQEHLDRLLAACEHDWAEIRSPGALGSGLLRTFCMRCSARHYSKPPSAPEFAEHKRNRA